MLYIKLPLGCEDIFLAQFKSAGILPQTPRGPYLLQFCLNKISVFAKTCILIYLQIIAKNIWLNM